MFAQRGREMAVAAIRLLGWAMNSDAAQLSSHASCLSACYSRLGRIMSTSSSSSSNRMAVSSCAFHTSSCTQHHGFVDKPPRQQSIAVNPHQHQQLLHNQYHQLATPLQAQHEQSREPLPTSHQPPLLPQHNLHEPTRHATVSPDEAAKFAALAEHWWDPDGPFKALHALNPARCRFIRTGLCDVFGRDSAQPAPLEGLKLLDVGCGGGILSEALARMGAHVLGVDVNEGGLRAAGAHAERDPGLAAAVHYRLATAERLAAEGMQFDAVVASEVIEHVESVPAFCASLAALTRPGGAVVVSTLNRTPRALALAVGVGEYVLRWAPPGTHDWARFITPEEIVVLMAGGHEQQQLHVVEGARSQGSPRLIAGGLRLEQLAGLMFDPLSWSWRLGSDTSVNYIALFSKPKLCSEAVSGSKLPS